jgi:hypothetical protein
MVVAAAAAIMRKVSDKETLALGYCPRLSCRQKEITRVTLKFFQEENDKKRVWKRIIFVKRIVQSSPAMV